MSIQILAGGTKAKTEMLQALAPVQEVQLIPQGLLLKWQKVDKHHVLNIQGVAINMFSKKNFFHFIIIYSNNQLKLQCLK